MYFYDRLHVFVLINLPLIIVVYNYADALSLSPTFTVHGAHAHATIKYVILTIPGVGDLGQMNLIDQGAMQRKN